MNTYMKEQEETEYEARMQELLKDKDRIIEAVKNSPFLRRKNEEAAEMLSRLKPPFPWDSDSSQNKK